MENPIEEFEDALSLCDLSDLCDHEIEPSNDNIPGSPSTQEDFFEFSTSETHSTISDDDIIFCGKVISCRTEDFPRNPSFPSSSSPSLLNKKKHFTSKSFSNHSSRSGNTSRSQSTNSRKQKVMIGLANIPTKMELKDLRERQSRRTPSTVSPAVGSAAGGSEKSQWGLLRLFRARSRDISSVLPKTSFGCISLARPCID